MAAYVIVDVDIRDQARYAEYVKMVPETVARYGGAYLARGGRTERLEGDWQPHRVVILRFESFERAREWWASSEYAAPKLLRQAISVTQMILVDGVP